MPRPLDADTLRERLAQLPAWRVDEGALRRDFAFADFSEAFAFLCRVALAAEKRDHHPDIANSYRNVTLRLSSHDAGGITERDLELAGAIDALV